jgi:hypothetical protein
VSGPENGFEVNELVTARQIRNILCVALALYILGVYTEFFLHFPFVTLPSGWDLMDLYVNSLLLVLLLFLAFRVAIPTILLLRVIYSTFFWNGGDITSYLRPETSKGEKQDQRRACIVIGSLMLVTSVFIFGLNLFRTSVPWMYWSPVSLGPIFYSAIGTVVPALIGSLVVLLTSSVIPKRSREADSTDITEGPVIEEPTERSVGGLQEFLSDGKGEPCSVCRTRIKAGERIVLCPHCHGQAHRDHMIDWLKTKKTCPLCRKRLR